MRELTIPEIEKLSSRKDVKKIAVEKKAMKEIYFNYKNKRIGPILIPFLGNKHIIPFVIILLILMIIGLTIRFIDPIIMVLLILLIPISYKFCYNRYPESKDKDKYLRGT